MARNWDRQELEIGKLGKGKEEGKGNSQEENETPGGLKYSNFSFE